MLEVFAFEFIPVACNLESADNIFTACLSGFNGLLECLKRRCFFAVPGEEQPIGPGCNSRFSIPRVNIQKFDNEGRSSWFGQGFIFTYKTYASAALGPASLCEHIIQFTHLNNVSPY